MSYGSGWGGSPWGGDAGITSVTPVFYDIEIDETEAAVSDTIFIGLHQIPSVIAAAQSPIKVEVVFSVAMSIDSNFLNSANYTITHAEGSVQIPVLSVVASGPLPLQRATLEVGVPLESKEYYFLTVSHSLISLTGDHSDPNYTRFQWKDQTTPIFRTPLEIAITDFSGEVHGGILGQPDGLVFFSPALEDVSSTSTLELEQISVCTLAYDSYEMPNPPDPVPLMTWGPGILAVTGPTSVLWAPHDRLGLPRMDVALNMREVLQPAYDYARSAILVETIDITKGGFMNDRRWGTFPATGHTVFTTAANKSSIGPGPTTHVTIDWPKIYLNDTISIAEDLSLRGSLDLLLIDGVFITDQVSTGILAVSVTDSVSFTDSHGTATQYSKFSNDSFFIADTAVATTLKVLSVTASDAVVIADLASTQKFNILDVAASDTLSASDSTILNIYITRVVSASDTVSITDTLALSPYFFFKVSLSDAIGTVDSVSPTTFSTLQVLVSDTLSVIDTSLRSEEKVVTLAADTIVTSDSCTTALFHVINSSASDTLSVTDSLALSLVYARTFNESLVVTEGLLIETFGNVQTSAQDTITVTDSLSLSSVFASVLSDSVSVSDSASLSFQYSRSVSDTVSVTNALSIEVSKGLADTAVVTDSNTVLLLATKSVVLGDTVSVTDSKTLDFYVAGSDNISVTDTILKNLEYGRSLSDTVSVTDTVSTSFVYNKTLSDTAVLPDVTQASSPVKYHTTAFSPAGLWNLNGNLNDSSGNGFTLTLESGGTARYATMSPGIKGFWFDGATRLVYNTTGSALQITGNLTIEMLITVGVYSANSVLISYGGNGSTAATNLLYNLAMATTDGIGLTWSSESGVASLSSFTSTLASLPLGQICHFAVTRNSDVIQFYLNGVVIGTASSALTTPATGTSSVFHIGGEAGTGTNFVPKYTTISSVKVIASALTGAQVLSEYQATLGQYFG